MSSVTRASLSQNVLNNLPTILPPLPEQTIITNYLDKKTKAIDQKINLLTKKAEKYKELRKSLINQTVTKGLDKTVKLKDSGINWIGEIPKHWEVKRLKDLYKLYTGNSISDKTLFENPNEAMPYIATKDVDFTTGKINYNNGIYIPIKDNSFRIALSNSTLICLEGASAGKK
jgi:type I restriction enzyme S subunit